MSVKHPEEVDELWEELSLLLNSCGDGPVRNVAEWKKAFTEWKSATRKKAREGKELNENEKKSLN
ncbi:hypothetical protein NQ315_015254 [Exocentrus adspersus]|uniref:Regulatory protein zeste n=1 Tax=Exocentrus adspersus TaxID=1586481 RepID=A0AAV8V4S6_9CUCU|nr:hypothetical protein NQ315_016578 [Exocentrus adspersus]KAJ8911253.1 hypothetical protein NQ315_015254 [Exocentrus adspersus]